MDINMEDTEEKHTVPAADNSDQMDVDSTAQPPQTPPPPAHRQQQSSNGTPSLPKLDLSSLPNPSTPLKGFRLEASATPRTPTPMGVPPERIKAPETTREMLSHIAWLSEELLRAGEEKVNLAQAAHDSVSDLSTSRVSPLITRFIRSIDIYDFSTKLLRNRKPLSP